MKTLRYSFSILLCLGISFMAFADVNKIDDGFYVNQGTWTDNQGQSGTILIQYCQDGLKAYSKTETSHGIVREGPVRYEYDNDYAYNLVVDFNGQPTTIGTGVCTAKQCETKVGDYAIETALLNRNASGHQIVRKLGSFRDPATGYVLLYRTAPTLVKKCCPADFIPKAQ